MDPLTAVYLDPATGSMAWQVAISSILAIAATCRIYWGELKRLLHLGSIDTPADADRPRPPQP